MVVARGFGNQVEKGLRTLRWKVVLSEIGPVSLAGKV